MQSPFRHAPTPIASFLLAALFCSAAVSPDLPPSQRCPTTWCHVRVCHPLCSARRAGKVLRVLPDREVPQVAPRPIECLRPVAAGKPTVHMSTPVGGDHDGAHCVSVLRRGVLVGCYTGLSGSYLVEIPARRLGRRIVSEFAVWELSTAIVLRIGQPTIRMRSRGPYSLTLCCLFGSSPLLWCYHLRSQSWCCRCCCGPVSIEICCRGLVAGLCRRLGFWLLLEKVECRAERLLLRTISHWITHAVCKQC